MTCSFRFCTILAFLKNGILQIARRLLGYESDLDTLSKTETSKPCIISKNGLVFHKVNILLSKIIKWTFILNRGHGLNTIHLNLLNRTHRFKKFVLHQGITFKERTKLRILQFYRHCKFPRKKLIKF